MTHYHGLPITPATCAEVAIRAGHAFVSFAHPGQMGIAVAACQSFALDNGAFSAWRKGEPITDWSAYYDFAAAGKKQPACDFAVIPDVIDGSEADNDALLDAWPLPRWFGAPVWHLHESFERLTRLCSEWPRVCLGSSGDYAQIGTGRWWRRMHQAMRTICDDAGQPLTRLHGLRMLDPDVFTKFPFASADSTNIGKNIGIDQRWSGPYAPPTKEARTQLMRARIESMNAPAVYDFRPRAGILGAAMMWWKMLFDAKHGLGRYYGRACFVQADTLERATVDLTVKAKDDYPGCEIEVVGIGESTADAARQFAEAKQRSLDWQARNRLKVCPCCKQEMREG